MDSYDRVTLHPPPSSDHHHHHHHHQGHRLVLRFLRLLRAIKKPPEQEDEVEVVDFVKHFKMGLQLRSYLRVILNLVYLFVLLNS